MEGETGNNQDSKSMTPFRSYDRNQQYDGGKGDRRGGEATSDRVTREDLLREMIFDLRLE